MATTDRVFLPAVRFERTVAGVGQMVEFFVFGNEETCGILIPMRPIIKVNNIVEWHALCELLDEEFVKEFPEIAHAYLEYLEEVGYIRHDDENYLGEIENEDGVVRCELFHLNGVVAGKPGPIVLDGEYYFIASADTELQNFLPLVAAESMSNNL